MAVWACVRGCTLCLFIITLGVVGFGYTWFRFRVGQPKCYVEYIYVPALNKSLNGSNSPLNNTLFFTLNFDYNYLTSKDVQYDDVRLSFRVFVRPNATRPFGSTTVPGFYQEFLSDTLKNGSVVARGGNFTAPVNCTVLYRVDFATAFRYKNTLRSQYVYTKEYPLWGGANVEIGDSGLKVYPKPIRLSGAHNLLPRYRAPALLTLCVAVLILLNAHE